MAEPIQPPNFNFSLFDIFTGLFVITLIIGAIFLVIYQFLKARYPSIKAIVFDKGLIYRKEFYVIEGGQFVEKNLLRVLLKQEKPCGYQIREYQYFHEPRAGGAFKIFVMAKTGSFYYPVKVNLTKNERELIIQQSTANRLYEEAISFFSQAQEQVKAFDALMATLIQSMPFIIFVVLSGVFMWFAGSILHDNYTQIVQANQQIAVTLKQTSDNLLLISNKTENQTKQMAEDYQKFLSQIQSLNLNVSGAVK